MIYDFHKIIKSNLNLDMQYCDNETARYNFIRESISNSTKCKNIQENEGNEVLMFNKK